MKKIMILSLSLLMSGCASTAYTDSSKVRTSTITHRTHASFYGNGEKLAKHTANGNVFNPHGMTAAHKTLPFGTHVKVTNLNNGKAVQVRINDRGPFVAGRGIDLTKGAAAKIGMIGSGTAPVKIEKVER